MVEEISQISKERELALENYHRDLVKVQEELTHEILHLKEQLMQANKGQDNGAEV